VLKAAGETETTQKISKIGFSWMKETLDSRFLSFNRFLNKCSTAIYFFIYFHQYILLNFPFICVLSFFLSFSAIFCFINPGDLTPNSSGLPRFLLYCFDEVQISKHLLLTIYDPIYRLFLGLHFDPEDGSKTFLENFDEDLPDYTASHPRTPRRRH
jgi:hypothetical protein